MYLAWIANFLLEYGENVVGALGVAIGTVGSLMVIYPDIVNRHITGLIRCFAPKIEAIEHARKNYREEGTVTDQDQLDPLLKFAEIRYISDETSAYHADLFGGIESVERIERTNEGVVGYDANDREWNFGPQEAGAAAIEADLLFTRTLQRYCRQRGMRFVAAGFVVLLIGHLLGIAGSAVSV